MNTYATSRTSSSEYAWKIFTTNEISDKALVARQAISVTCYEAGELETEFRIPFLRYSAVVARYGPLFNFSKNRSNKYGHLGHFSHSSNDYWDDQQLRSHPQSNFCKMPDDQMTYLPDQKGHLAIARNQWILFEITKHEYLVIQDLQQFGS